MVLEGVAWSNYDSYTDLIKCFNIHERLTMSNDGTFTPWLQLPKEDFVHSVRRLKSGRTVSELLGIELHIGMSRNEAIFSTQGVQTRCRARGAWPGFACLSAGQLYAYTQVQPPGRSIRLDLHGDRLHVNTFRIPTTWVMAPAWATRCDLEAQFFGPDVEPDSDVRFCPVCGKKAGVLLASLPIKFKRWGSEKQLYHLKEHGTTTHGCFLCGHGWAEVGIYPPALELTP